MNSDIRLEHIAIAVRDLEGAVSLYRSILGVDPSGRERLESEGVQTAFFDLDGTRLELLEPTAPDTTVGRFLQRRGPGLHHIALEVSDLDAALERCAGAGLETVGEAPRIGAGGRRVAFLHPRDTRGTLIELSESDES